MSATILAHAETENQPIIFILLIGVYTQNSISDILGVLEIFKLLNFHGDRRVLNSPIRFSDHYEISVVDNWNPYFD